MALSTPIKLTLYAADDSVIATYSRSVVSGRFLERAINLNIALEEQGNSKDVLDAMDQLIVDFFGGQFSIDQLKDGADIEEKYAVLAAMMTKATRAFSGFEVNGNPTKPGTKTRRRQKTG